MLTQALRAEKVPGLVCVRMLPADTPAAEVATVAHDHPVRLASAELGQVDELSDEDWRAEVMGRATVQV